ncbi:hypothetical protein P8452_17442 [Trifolium repens]|nr:pre-mRNA-splicing factor SYF1 [Trifolium repens]WJX28763.1 hypothetical protein P8452_17442 [Trifolium repens]
MKLHKSLRLWTFYVDLAESLGNLESTREVYERILDLRIATPQVIINYAYFLERYGKTKLERARELFENAVGTVSCVQLRDDLLSMLLDS